MQLGDGMMDVLPKADDVVIATDKFTKYVLHPKNSNGKHFAFERALGYTLENHNALIENIRTNIKNFPAKMQINKGHGVRYSVEMELLGSNGRRANVMTAWMDDKDTGTMRLISAYVKKRKGENDD